APPEAGFPARLLEKLDLRDGHAPLHGLHHIVDGQGRHRCRGERLHLDTGLVHRADARLDRQLTAAQVVAECDVAPRDAQGVTQGNELRRALGRQDTGGARDAEHVALRRVAAADHAQRRGHHTEGRAGYGPADGLLLRGDVHHAGIALRREVREAPNCLRYPSAGQAVTPARACRMIASIRSLAISFSFLSSLILHCRSAESGGVPFSVSNSWSQARCSPRRRRNSSFSAVSRSMRDSWSMRGLLVRWRVRHCQMWTPPYIPDAPEVSRSPRRGLWKCRPSGPDEVYRARLERGHDRTALGQAQIGHGPRGDR